MADLIKKIRTAKGDLQIDYNALANLPERTLYSAYNHETGEQFSEVYGVKVGEDVYITGKMNIPAGQPKTIEVYFESDIGTFDFASHWGYTTAQLMIWNTASDLWEPVKDGLYTVLIDGADLRVAPINVFFMDGTVPNNAYLFFNLTAIWN